jgi:hypothetical protein
MVIALVIHRWLDIEADILALVPDAGRSLLPEHEATASLAQGTGAAKRGAAVWEMA